MDWLTFISAFVDSVAWPIAAVVIALLFRQQISGLLRKIRRLTWGDHEVDFTDTLDEAETISKEVEAISDKEPPSNTHIVTLPGINDRFERLLKISPAAAVLDTWRAVELELRQIGHRRDYDMRVLVSPSRTADRLLSEQVISKRTRAVIRFLQQLRNRAAHELDRGISIADAWRFYELSEDVLILLRRVE